MAQHLDRGQHPGVLGDDMPHPPERLVIEPAPSPLQVLLAEVPQRGHAERGGTTFAGGPARGIPAVGVRVTHPRVDDQDRQPGLGQTQRDDVGNQGAAVEEDRRVGLAKQRRGLIHDPGGGTDDDVFGALPDPGQGRPVQPEPPGGVEGERDRALDRGRGGQARSDGDVAGEGQVETRHRGEVGAVLGERPRHPEGVCRPPEVGGGAQVVHGRLDERCRSVAVEVGGEPDRAVLAQP